MLTNARTRPWQPHVRTKGGYNTPIRRGGVGQIVKRAYSAEGTDYLPPKVDLSPALRYSGGPLQVGHWAAYTKQFTLKDVVTFSELCGDKNPIHLDETAAAQSRFGFSWYFKYQDMEKTKHYMFKRRVVHGLLTASLISTVAGMQMPGPGSIYLKQTLSFKRPVFIDDTVTAVCEVVSIRNDKIVTVQTTCYNQNGEVCIDGSAIVLRPENP